MVCPLIETVLNPEVFHVSITLPPVNTDELSTVTLQEVVVRLRLVKSKLGKLEVRPEVRSPRLKKSDEDWA
jgi:predicted aspartyl protease